MKKKKNWSKTNAAYIRDIKLAIWKKHKAKKKLQIAKILNENMIVRGHSI